MTDLTTGTRLAQDLDSALAAYQRHYGLPRAIERLDFMMARAREAQRVLDDASARIGGTVTKAAAE